MTSTRTIQWTEKQALLHQTRFRATANDFAHGLKSGRTAKGVFSFDPEHCTLTYRQFSDMATTQPGVVVSQIIFIGGFDVPASFLASLLARQKFVIDDVHTLLRQLQKQFPDPNVVGIVALVRSSRPQRHLIIMPTSTLSDLVVARPPMLLYPDGFMVVDYDTFVTENWERDPNP